MPQDGVFRVSYFDKGLKRNVDLDFRVATCPAIVGENVTIRILDSRKAKVGLENLNHSRDVLEPFMRLLKSSAPARRVVENPPPSTAPYSISTIPA